MEAGISPESNTKNRISRRPRRVWTEILASYGLILGVIWTPRPAQRILWWLAAAAVVFCTAISFDGAAGMGLRAKNFIRSIWIIGVALAVSAAAILGAVREHTLRIPPGALAFLQSYFAYALWACTQQFLLQSFFLQRFLRLLPAPWMAALAAAGIFALAHLPNPILTPITLAWGIASCLLFLRYRNLYTLAIAHAVLGITVAITIPGYVDHNMRVGLGYLTYADSAAGLRHTAPLPQP